MNAKTCKRLRRLAQSVADLDPHQHARYLYINQRERSWQIPVMGFDSRGRETMIQNRTVKMTTSTWVNHYGTARGLYRAMKRTVG